MARTRADEVLELVGLASSGRRAVYGYSLGMRQRLAQRERDERRGRCHHRSGHHRLGHHRGESTAMVAATADWASIASLLW